MELSIKEIKKEIQRLGSLELCELERLCRLEIEKRFKINTFVFTSKMDKEEIKGLEHEKKSN